MNAERMHKIGQELGSEVEYLVPLPKPYVTLFGVAANGGGRPLANVLKVTASKHYYEVVAELPLVRFSEAMTAEITREIQGLELGMGLEFFLHCFVSLTKHSVILSGDAANAPGRLANVVELEAAVNRHYRVLVELPQVRFCENEVEWTVSFDGEVTIEGQVTPATIFDDKRLIGSRRNRMQLCPTEPCAISFNLPGPVDYSTTQVSFTADNYMEILVRKTDPEAETSADGLWFTVFGGYWFRSR